MNSTLTRSDDDRMIGGVCGGLARYFGIDSAIVRLIFVLAVLSGVSPLDYVVLWVILPAEQPSKATSAPMIAEHPRPAKEWKYDPYTGEKIER